MAKFLFRAQYNPEGLKAVVRQASPPAKSTFALSSSQPEERPKPGTSVTAKKT